MMLSSKGNKGRNHEFGFYRQLTPILAITFDLDYTLYDNGSVIDKTEPKLLNFIRCYDDLFNNLQYC